MEKSAIQYMDTSSKVEIFSLLNKTKNFSLGGNTAVTQKFLIFQTPFSSLFECFRQKKKWERPDR